MYFFSKAKYVQFMMGKGQKCTKKNCTLWPIKKNAVSMKALMRLIKTDTKCKKKQLEERKKKV